MVLKPKDLVEILGEKLMKAPQAMARSWRLEPRAIIVSIRLYAKTTARLNVSPTSPH